MTIQIDTREKSRAIKKILEYFNNNNINYYTSKLFVGDFMSLDNPRLIIDRKQNLSEICANVCQNHDRFRNELIRARENGIKLVILIEHSNQIKSIDDVASKWTNPRLKEKKEWVEDELCTNKKGEEYWVPGYWKVTTSKAMTGETLARVMRTQERKYGCKFMFCDKLHTGKRILEILSKDAEKEDYYQDNRYDDIDYEAWSSTGIEDESYD